MTKIKIKTNIKSRQFKLYNYLKNKDPNEWTFQEKIARDLPDLYPATEKEFEDFHNSSCRRLIGEDIRAINEDDYLHKPILSSGKGVKMANEAEFNDYIGSNINSVIKRLKRLKKMAQKGGQNGQMRIKLSDYQKEVYESFIDSKNTDNIENERSI